MSPIIVLALVAALAVAAAVVFFAVVIGIRSEPHSQMATRAQRPVAVIVRRLLGVYVSKPTGAATDDNREGCLTGQSTDWWHRGGWDQ
jgi:hypothetical protein